MQQQGDSEAMRSTYPGFSAGDAHANSSAPRLLQFMRGIRPAVAAAPRAGLHAPAPRRPLGSTAELAEEKATPSSLWQSDALTACEATTPPQRGYPMMAPMQSAPMSPLYQMATSVPQYRYPGVYYHVPQPPSRLQQASMQSDGTSSAAYSRVAPSHETGSSVEAAPAPKRQRLPSPTMGSSLQATPLSSAKYEAPHSEATPESETRTAHASSHHYGFYDMRSVEHAHIHGMRAQSHASAPYGMYFPGSGPRMAEPANAVFAYPQPSGGHSSYYGLPGVPSGYPMMHPRDMPGAAPGSARVPMGAPKLASERTPTEQTAASLSSGGKSHSGVQASTASSGSSELNGRAPLSDTHPHVTIQWHPSKNKGLRDRRGALLTPDLVSAGSQRRVWWLCEYGHEWEARINHRTNAREPRGCPTCAGKRRRDETLTKTHPEIAAEWDTERNANITDRWGKPVGPDNVTAGSGRRVWWLCSQSHSWECTVYHRTARRNPRTCPFCRLNRRADEFDAVLCQTTDS